jgi:hypothetical protein
MGTSFSVDKVKKFIENFIVILNRMQIRAALNQQTAVQFSQYASQQSPGNKQLTCCLFPGYCCDADNTYLLFISWRLL